MADTITRVTVPWRNAALAAVAAGSGALVLWASRSGLGISPDSVTYVAGATALNRGEGVLDISGAPLTLFPPGLPVFLALLGTMGLPITTAALVVNVACAALSVLLAYRLAHVVLASDRAALVAAVLVGLSPAMANTHSMLWTEPPFTVLLLAVLVTMTGSWGQRWTMARLATIVLLVWLASSVRYVGFILVIVAAISVWLNERGREHGISRAVGVGCAASLVPILILTRNLVLGSGALGERYPASQTWLGALQHAVDLWGSYLVPGAQGGVQALVGLAFAGLLGLGVLFGFRRISPATVVAITVVLYWLAIWWSQATTRVDVGSDRFGFPILAPSLILLWLGGRTVVSVLSRQVWLWRSVTVVAWTAVGVTCVAGAWRGVVVASEAGAAGRGYASSALTEAPMARVLAALPSGRGVAATDPWLAWWVRQAGPALAIPPTEPNWPRERTAADLTRLEQAVRQGRVSYLAYLVPSDPVLGPAALAGNGFTVTQLARESDGTLYSISFAKG